MVRDKKIISFFLPVPKLLLNFAVHIINQSNLFLELFRDINNNFKNRNMSTAERTARQFYQAHNLWKMPEDVKKQLIILMLNTDTSSKETDSIPPYTKEELETRCLMAYNEAKDGLARPFDELITETEARYPWLCD